MVIGLSRTRWMIVLGLLLALVGVAYLGYVGYEGSRQFVEGDKVPHGCATPATLGWAYEAVNYDIALDARLPQENPRWLEDCPLRGSGTAGSEIVASDGIRIAGWYVPSPGKLPTAPTIILAHGWGGVDKSDMLRYAATLHADFNLAILDFRGNGRSSPAPMTMGTLEYRDLAAFLDWLERAKHPASIGVLGDSGGAAAAAKLARTDLRIAALALESPYARLSTLLGRQLLNAGHPALGPSILAIEVGIALRIGSWPDSDPADLLPHLGRRPLAISYGTSDQKDVPAEAADLLYRLAVDAGLDVEAHPVAGAGHGLVVNASPDAYRAWAVPFFRRSLGG